MPLGREISIGQLAARTGLAVSAIRYYETEGLIRSERNAGGHRRFERSVIRRLSFIRIAQQFGFSLDRIRTELAALPEGRTPTRQDWAGIGAGLRAELDARIEALVAMRDRLDGCIGCGCLSLESCALYNPEDKAAKRGAGPRYLMGDRSEEI
ncbi:redox-sensitive transcriptional activator SoxR [Tropicimonas sp. TH_r6]|uniref:redox-sensitive transcriptional activator SoxR n=1 Tax=Tropicimonas sp. TH_r6 TaxID=3082085 RepID=UPI002953E9C3|nr:redox-sensitive transcriptional activator SoxR [Tropicimonas sp. TH_r6]MDV7145194.1 redox-sensitive transcriptional activator SoxR [Tropicimonas sp. TH_r6]